MKLRNSYFFDKENFRTINTFRIYYLMIFILLFLFTEIGRNVYRPFIYKNNINDYGIADSIGNLGGIIVQIFFGLAILNPTKKKGIRLVVFFSCGYILYEIVQPILPRGVFDWKDIYGTIIGGILGIMIFLIIHRFGNNKILKKFNP